VISSQLPALQVVLPLVAAPLCVLFHNRTFAWLLMVFVSLASFGISCALFNQVLAEDTITYAMGGWVAPWGIEYYIDKLTTYMLLIVNGIAVLVSLGARESVENEISSDRIYLFYTAFLLNLTGLLGVIITGDAFNLFVFIEIASLSSYAIISLGKDKRCLYAAFRYLVYGTVGASFILISIGLLYAVTGTLNIADLSQQLANAENTTTITTAFVFFVIGIAIKAAIFPMHLWLPDAYTYSPSIVSTFLAGTTTKVFIYVLIRFIYSLYGYEFSFFHESFDNLLIIIACGAILYGSYRAIKQDSLKRLLAYSSIAQIGYMILGIALITELGLAASLIHIFNHAFIKVGLFLAVTAIIYSYGTDSIECLAGMAKTSPFTFVLFLISGLSIIGVPLTSGFISKWYLIKASLEAGYWALVVIIVFSSVLAIIYIGRVIETAYFKPETKNTASLNNKKMPHLLFLSLFIFSFINIYLGIETSLNVDMAFQIAHELINK
jgi:multicomponent Na+:H+ antiporter subunit D